MLMKEWVSEGLKVEDVKFKPWSRLLRCGCPRLSKCDVPGVDGCVRLKCRDSE